LHLLFREVFFPQDLQDSQKCCAKKFFHVPCFFLSPSPKQCSDVEKLIAALSSYLVHLKMQDAVADAPSLKTKLLANLAKKTGCQAQKILSHQIPFEKIQALLQRQQIVEQTPGLALEEYVLPTAECFGLVYASVTNDPEKKASFQKIGQCLGTILVLADALLDYSQDKFYKTYNLISWHTGENRDALDLAKKRIREKIETAFQQARKEVQSLSAFRCDAILLSMKERIFATHLQDEKYQEKPGNFLGFLFMLGILGLGASKLWIMFGILGFFIAFFLYKRYKRRKKLKEENGLILRINGFEYYVSAPRKFIMEMQKPTNPASEYIASQLSPIFFKLKLQDPFSVKNMLQLTEELRKMLASPDFYQETRFAHVVLEEEIQVLIQKNPTGKERIALNYLLFHAACPEYIEKKIAKLQGDIEDCCSVAECMDEIMEECGCSCVDCCRCFDCLKGL
jgi:hypothetical protein